MPTPRTDPARERHYAGVREHERLAGLLTPADRELLRRAADVLEPGAVVLGMATREREGVVPDWHYARGARLVRAPAGPGGASGQTRALPPSRPSPTTGVLG